MPESQTKRRRLVLSCFECKRRKLKCGRETPICSRCINVGTPELCEYDPRYSMSTDSNAAGAACASQGWSSNNSISQLSTTVFENFDASIISENFQPSPWLPFQIGLDLESSSSDALDGESLLGPRESYTQHSVTDQRRGLNGRFRGPSHHTSIVASFKDFCKFMKRTVEEHHILGAPQWATFPPGVEQPVASYPLGEITGVIKRLLPAEERCRTLLKSYFDHFTGVYALFHHPSFWHDYQDYQDGLHKNPSRFNAMLLAMMSCARCLFVDDPLSFDGDSSTARNEAVGWLYAVEAWLSYRPAEGTIVERFQFRCLVLFSKMLNDIDHENHYTASQNLLAAAISDGLHRDWKALGVEETVYEHELRRKVWIAIVELDLAACTERGVPSMVSSLFVDIGQPKNYNDSDYITSTEVEPAAQPDGKLTDGSFAKMAHSIRPIRYQVIGLVNNPQKHGTLQPAFLTAFRVQISEVLDNLPDWSDSTSDTEQHNQGLIYRAVLELHLHELLLLLHLPFALVKDNTVSSSIDTDFQRFICVRSASTIIKIYELVARKGFSPIALGTASLLRAGLCLCLFEEDAVNHGITSLPICQATRVQLVKSALTMVEQHVLSLGTDLQSLWLLSAASCYMESRQNPDTSATSKNRTTDNIVALFSKLCWAQKHKNIGFGLSDSQFARYVMQIHQVCTSVGQILDSETDLDMSSALINARAMSMKSTS